MRQERVESFFDYLTERYDIYLRRKAGYPAPWTADPILQTRYFCNVFRRHDRTSKLIFKLVKSAPDPATAVRASLVGRHINRADQIPLVWEAVQTGSLKKVARVTETIVFNDAYKIHTKRGMWNRLGVAEACMQPLPDMGETLAKCRSMLEARAALEYTTNSPFLLYQVLLDLWGCKMFDKPFEPNDWIWMAGGTLRALAYMEGDFKYSANRVGRTSWDRPPTAAEHPILEQRIRRLVKLSRREPVLWPAENPKLGIHDIEFNLCEFDKYQRVSNEGAQRMHIRYFPLRTRIEL